MKKSNKSKRNLKIAGLIITIGAGLALTLYDPTAAWDMVAFKFL